MKGNHARLGVLIFVVLGMMYLGYRTKDQSELRRRGVTVSGMVARPGVVRLPPEGMTLGELLAKVGVDAAATEALIFRDVHEGREDIHAVDLAKMRRGEGGPRLSGGESVHVRGKAEASR